MIRYGLPPDVFVAFEGSHSVWLDVRQDRYFAIERSRTHDFHALVRGWPERAGEPSGVPGATPLGSLLKSGLLVELARSPHAKGVRPAAASRLTGEICVPALAPRACIRGDHVLCLAGASLAAAITLKWRGLAKAIARLQQRRRSVEAPTGQDRDALAQLICAFAMLRPFFFASHDRCLLTTLALSEFLFKYRVRPQWVIGVNARPFSAHCWLEQGSWVLNDTVERVRRYTPILRV